MAGPQDRKLDQKPMDYVLKRQVLDPNVVQKDNPKSKLMINHRPLGFASLLIMCCFILDHVRNMTGLLCTF